MGVSSMNGGPLQFDSSAQRHSQRSGQDSCTQLHLAAGGSSAAMPRVVPPHTMLSESRQSPMRRQHAYPRTHCDSKWLLHLADGRMPYVFCREGTWLFARDDRVITLPSQVWFAGDEEGWHGIGRPG